jgi:TRAP-type C4-dicarboxylate transport system substrate-binding protein
MKKILALGLVIAMMSTLLVGCGSSSTTSTTTDSSTSSGNSAEAAGTTTLKVGHVYGETYAMHVALQHMSDTIYEKTDGRYQLDIYANRHR